MPDPEYNAWEDYDPADEHPAHPERIWLVDAVEGSGAVGWTAEEPLDPNEPGVAYVRADLLAEARALLEADADEDADVPLAELIQGHFDAYEAEIARLRSVVQSNIDLCNRLADLPPEWRDDLLRFMEIMAEKLRANLHKGHWEHLAFSYLARRMGEEITELKTALRDVLPIEVSREAADVANFAMMIAANALRCEQEQAEGGAA